MTMKLREKWWYSRCPNSMEARKKWFRSSAIPMSRVHENSRPKEVRSIRTSIKIRSCSSCHSLHWGCELTAMSSYRVVPTLRKSGQGLCSKVLFWVKLVSVVTKALMVAIRTVLMIYIEGPRYMTLRYQMKTQSIKSTMYVWLKLRQVAIFGRMTWSIKIQKQHKLRSWVRQTLLMISTSSSVAKIRLPSSSN